MRVDRIPSRTERVAADLTRTLDGLSAESILAHALNMFPGRIAIASSFGAESAVLLHILSTIAPATPVLFLDTGQLFDETIAYRDTLVARLGLSDVRNLGPDPRRLSAEDAGGQLWARNADRCCALRKVQPMARALACFDAWVTGRKQFQGAARSLLPVVEADGERLKFNPLATWTEADVASHLARHELPRHPLVARGYRSIGCWPCTTPTRPGEDAREGRWRGSGKTECGLHTRLQHAAAPGS
jgi:phosphoadenosine phosphosulfate reductase